MDCTQWGLKAIASKRHDLVVSADYFMFSRRDKVLRVFPGSEGDISLLSNLEEYGSLAKEHFPRVWSHRKLC